MSCNNLSIYKPTQLTTNNSAYDSSAAPPITPTAVASGRFRGRFLLPCRLRSLPSHRRLSSFNLTHPAGPICLLFYHCSSILQQNQQDLSIFNSNRERLFSSFSFYTNRKFTCSHCHLTNLT